MKQSMREHPLRLFGEKGPESLVMRKYPARFGKGVTKKGHETIMVPRWYPTSFGGGHTEKGSNAPRWVPTLPLLSLHLCTCDLAAPPTVFSVTRSHPVGP